jgi:putative membrane protein
MHVGKSYRLVDFAMWSRRSALYMLVVSLVAVAAYSLPPLAGFAIPWPIVLVLGTTVSLVAGFKNSQVLQRSGDGLQTFAQIAANSRILASICCDFLDADTARRVIRRHLAWLTALRYSLRRPMPWESIGRPANREFRRRYHIQEDLTPLPQELESLIGSEGKAIAAQPQPALTLLHLQDKEFNTLFKEEKILPQAWSELTKVWRDCHDQQARCDRIKNSPYPRQYAIVSAMFVFIFCTLLPFGLVQIFAEMGTRIGGMTGAAMLWLSVPFSVLIGWSYFSLDQVGESTSNPFEGNANDVPISQICRDLEIELRARLGETDLPPGLQPVHGIST